MNEPFRKELYTPAQCNFSDLKITLVYTNRMMDLLTFFTQKMLTFTLHDPNMTYMDGKKSVSIQPLIHTSHRFKPLFIPYLECKCKKNYQKKHTHFWLYKTKGCGGYKFCLIFITV